MTTTSSRRWPHTSPIRQKRAASDTCSMGLIASAHWYHIAVQSLEMMVERVSLRIWRRGGVCRYNRKAPAIRYGAYGAMDGFWYGQESPIHVIAIQQLNAVPATRRGRLTCRLWVNMLNSPI